MKTEYIFLDINPVEVKNDLVASWNDAQDVLTDLRTLPDSELPVCRRIMSERLGRVVDLLGKYVTDEDIIESL